MSRAVAGYKAALHMSTAEGGSVARVAELTNFALRPTHSPVNATSHDSSGDRELVPGTGQWSATADLLWVQDSTTHQPVADVLSGRAKVDAEFYMSGSSSDGYYSGTGYVTQLELGAPNEEALNAGVSLEGDGALTRNSSST